ncbi:hypothetical protein PanWU01x14_233960 [Parasponia andersonii]|uniref:Uncharacterized protein n=1 Tax=Parasponia andersonii TaxID=3476 RepID=A0A2P5BJB9_PARAD|nr:hypothetical protein PanWU01x14_233960 [Parasponia andersonii]
MAVRYCREQAVRWMLVAENHGKMGHAVYANLNSLDCVHPIASREEMSKTRINVRYRVEDKDEDMEHCDFMLNRVDLGLFESDSNENDIFFFESLLREKLMGAVSHGTAKG